jgi:hypothetical protein
MLFTNKYKYVIEKMCEEIIDTFFLHVDLQTFLEPAGLALVSACHVHCAGPVLLANVVQVPEKYNNSQICMQRLPPNSDQGSINLISPSFYEQILRVQIPKVQKILKT